MYEHLARLNAELRTMERSNARYHHNNHTKRNKNKYEDNNKNQQQKSIEILNSSRQK